MSLLAFAQQAEKNRKERFSQNGPDWSDRITNCFVQGGKNKGEAGKPMRGFILTPLDTCFPWEKHDFEEKTPINAVCNSMYRDIVMNDGKPARGLDGEVVTRARECKPCWAKGLQPPKDPSMPSNPAKTTYSFIFYCLDLVGEKRKAKNSETVYEVSPLTIIDVPIGKARKNLLKLQEAHRTGVLYKKIIQFKSINGDGFQTPEFLLPEELGNEIPTAVPEDILKRFAVPIDPDTGLPYKPNNYETGEEGHPIRQAYDNMVLALIFAPRRNVDWDYLGLVNPWGNDSPDAKGGEAATPEGEPAAPTSSLDSDAGFVLPDFGEDCPDDLQM